ncbi:SPOSA6832_03997, partial [Sporobolomyces salmonicolor]
MRPSASVHSGTPLGLSLDRSADPRGSTVPTGHKWMGWWGDARPAPLSRLCARRTNDAYPSHRWAVPSRPASRPTVRPSILAIRDRFRKLTRVLIGGGDFATAISPYRNKPMRGAFAHWVIRGYKRTAQQAVYFAVPLGLGYGVIQWAVKDNDLRNSKHGQAKGLFP